MQEARVLVVDDSLTMRALISGMLERATGIKVVGMAADADEARTMITTLQPNVMTLDIEMPGMNGLQFLEETMRERPLPVIMLSTLTQKGAKASIEAARLGAVDSFPKPTSTSMDEFNRLAPKLAALVIAAANGKVSSSAEREIRRAKKSTFSNFSWNGKMIAIGGSTGGVEALFDILPDFPFNCPPTVVVQQFGSGFTDALIDELDSVSQAKIVPAINGAALQQGHVYFATSENAHLVIDRWPDPAIRLLPADPVNGRRPSIDLLFATLAKTARSNAIGVMLTGMGKDGAAGLKALRVTGALTIGQDQTTSVVYEAPGAAKALGAVELELPLNAIAKTALNSCHLLAHQAA
jgi:two-component system, chemotaxis family, protein-glutamate methylesterase/glutaminase